jgi:hypothetical protein
MEKEMEGTVHDNVEQNVTVTTLYQSDTSSSSIPNQLHIRGHGP